ncbi:MAG: Fe-S cluster assembly protein SufD [Gemmatimonadota bacterium]|nr:Fe-S cluster assembly protein SufD [Gemmatimonadota bacterium]
MSTPVLDARPAANSASSTASSPATRRYLDGFDAFAGARDRNGANQPAWLAATRRRAIERFDALGFPTPKNEDWHFTSVAPIAEAELSLLSEPSVDVKPAALAPFIFGRPEWPALVFVNGRFSPALSTLRTLPAGVRVLDLARAWREEPALLERYLTRHAALDGQTFTALNTAFIHDGAVVHIAKDAEITSPVHIMFVSDANAAKGIAHPRTLIVADRHSKATVIESYVAIGDPFYFTNAVTEAVVAEGATLNHYKIQRESSRAFHVGTTEVHQARDSHFVSFSFATGGSLSRTNIYTVLDGPGCGATLNGLYMVDGEQHVDHQTRIEHAEPNCFSREVYKGILDGSSHGVFNGKVLVRPAAQKTDGKQSNNNLLLSARARVDTKPQLEIFADDVKCTHGATVGKLDEQALFYMKSRGLDRTVARQLLTYAFAADVLEQIEVDEVREGLEALALSRFTGADVTLEG